MTEDFKGRIGKLIRDARTHRGLTQQQLADRLSTSQSAVNRIEKGHQNLSLEMVARIGSALDSEIVALGAGPTHLRITGPTTLSGEITIGRANSACALLGTSNSASTCGHTSGPPAENAYAVDPVGVAHSTPSQP